MRIRQGTDFRVRSDLSATVFLEDPNSYDGGELTIEDQFGVRVLGAYMTAANGMVEIQYQVLDADKAAGLAGDDTSPVIEAHGTTFDTPGLSGHGHTHRVPTEGQRGFVLLANTAGGLREGDEVTMRIGRLLLEGVVLE